MQLQVLSRGVEIGPALRIAIERRVRFTFGRFGARIRRVKVTFQRRGEETCCRIVVYLAKSAQMCVEDADADGPEAVVERLFDRVGRLAGRELERQRERAS